MQNLEDLVLGHVLLYKRAKSAFLVAQKCFVAESWHRKDLIPFKLSTQGAQMQYWSIQLFHPAENVEEHCGWRECGSSLY